jgi:DNA-binding beta-propeller fold protein YncE
MAPKTTLLLGCLPFAAALLAAPVLAAAPAHSPDVYVTRFFDNDLQRFYGPQSATPGAAHASPGETGSQYSQSVVARRPWGIAFGPDGNLFVANQQGGDGAIMRVQGPFGASPGAPAPAPGQMADVFVPTGNFYTLAFGLDQNLYAASAGAVQRFDVATGASMGDFTTGRTPVSVEGIALGPDQNLYVASYNACAPGPTCTTTTGEILRFDGKTGAFLDVFVASGVGGLQHPGGIGFGTNGDLFVCNEFVDNLATGEVLRFHGPLNAASGQPYPAPGQTGALFASTDGITPFQLAFGPDRTLYVTHSTGIIAYNGRSGVFQGNFASVSEARGIAFYNGGK